MYFLAGGSPQSVSGLDKDDEIVRWNPDGRSLLVSHGTLAVRLERFDLATGRRDLIKTVSPPDAVGVTQVRNITVADDVNVYAYGARLQLSRLFLFQGAR